MDKVCFVDIDGVVANTTERFNKAEEAKQQYLEEVKAGKRIVENTNKPGFVGNADKEATNVFWQTAFNPELVSLDTLIPGVTEALIGLCVDDYTIIFLTSRPESMRQATMDWLIAQNAKVEEGFFTQYEKIIMKAPAFQFVKTVVWKAGMVQTLAAFHNATEVMFVDDEKDNRLEVFNRAAEFADMYDIYCFASLKEALEAQGE